MFDPKIQSYTLHTSLGATPTFSVVAKCFARLDSVADIDNFMEYKDKCGLLSALQEMQKLRQLDKRGNFTRLQENCDLPECDAVRLVRFIPALWRKLLSPSAVQKQFFYPENGRKITVRNVGTKLMNYIL